MRVPALLLAMLLSACAAPQGPPMSDQERMQRMQMALEIWKASQAPRYQVPPPQFPQQTRCTTVPTGYGGWRTVCD